MCRHERWINLATKKAEEHYNPGNYKHVAVLVRGSNVIAFGVNHSKRGIIFDKVYGVKAFHSEADALSKFEPDELSNAILYVAGISPGGNVINSRPCELCQQVIKKYFLKATYYNDRGVLRKL